MTTNSTPCRIPISKSFGSCAAVTLTAPVPNSGSTNSSAMIGIIRSTNGSNTFLPTKCLYLSSLGFTATAPSPSMVSALVVATVIFNSSLPYLIDTNSPASSLCSTSISDNAVKHLGHQLIIRSAR
ncbi:unannotated protein [freshwater metagenome]|uniref:Unannotated protein n=1 Tax=freshwater metagenome TaxID=449393 RepID=A0A6J6RNJ5_9ZZZZ